MWYKVIAYFPNNTGDVYFNTTTNLFIREKNSKYIIGGVIEDSFSCSEYSTSNYFPLYSSYNGKPIYEEVGGTATPRYMWYDSSISRWILGHNVGYATEESWDSENEKYIGDVWYSSSTIEGEYVARGSLRGNTQGAFEGTPLHIREKQIEGWQSPSLFGIYKPIAGSVVTGNKYVGWKKLLGDNSLGNLQQTNSVQGGSYIFEGDGFFLFNDSDSSGTSWILNTNMGSPDSDTGYWEGSAIPTFDVTPVQFSLVYSGDPSLRPTPEHYSLSFVEYNNGNDAQTEDGIIGQVAVWL